MADAIEAYEPARVSRRTGEARLAGAAGDGEADAPDPAERHSLRWRGNELEYDGDFFGDLPTAATGAGRPRWLPR